MFKEFEVLEIYSNAHGEEEDSDIIGSIQLNTDVEDIYYPVKHELTRIGLNIPSNWSIVSNSYMESISVYDSRGRYRYQLRSF